jgi:hypothetical protein
LLLANDYQFHMQENASPFDQKFKGWRTSAGDPSLAEVNSSIAVPKKPGFRRFAAFPSAIWTPATGRPRSPAAHSSATRC